MVALRALKKIWLNGELVPWGEARVHVLSHALHYGYAVFEGIRCHSTPDGPAIFRLDEHLERFANSAKIYRMTIPYSAAALKAACVALVRANGVPEAYLRPIAFSGYGEMGLDPSKSAIETAIGEWEWGALLGPSGPAPGVRATVSSWVRIDSRSLPPQAKCAANYANGALAKMEAAAGGYDEAILLNAQGMVAEGTAENIFRVKKGVVSTPPASSGILRGVTRDTVIRLLHQQGIPFQRTDFTREELFSADELFFTGTAVGIAPVREVDGRAIGDGTYPLTERIRALYDTAVHGRAEGYRHWLTYVQRPSPDTGAASGPRLGTPVDVPGSRNGTPPAPIYAAPARARAGPR
ncbi:MAG TPA: branched-chain amino acid transaminase [Thermoplasmata archaeon]|nr:branched-chain amino acid transaminase [Thermoplasmata archaeon]